jgi:transposase-like protein
MLSEGRAPNMTSLADVPKCPKCKMPMRLTRVVPSIVRTEGETQTFVCSKCATTITRTGRSG